MLEAGGGEVLVGPEDEITARELVDEMLVGYDYYDVTPFRSEAT